MKYPIIFALLTGLCWGLYGPILGYSRASLDNSPFKPYVAIGIAYLIWGVFGGIVGMLSKGDSFSFTGPGALWGLAAGTLGAWGALALTLAMYTGGHKIPFVVMPLVFGGAVTVSSLYPILYAALAEKKALEVNPLMWVGVAGILVSVILVASYAPVPKGAHPPKTTAAPPPSVPQETAS